MARDQYTLTTNDKDILNALVLELASELDLHYEDEDMHALSKTFSVIKDAIALIERAGFQPHSDILAIVARYNRTQQ